MQVTLHELLNVLILYAVCVCVQCVSLKLIFLRRKRKVENAKRRQTHAIFAKIIIIDRSNP